MCNFNEFSLLFRRSVLFFLHKGPTVRIFYSKAHKSELDELSPLHRSEVQKNYTKTFFENFPSFCPTLVLSYANFVARGHKAAKNQGLSKENRLLFNNENVSSVENPRSEKTCFFRFLTKKSSFFRCMGFLRVFAFCPHFSGFCAS